MVLIADDDASVQVVGARLFRQLVEIHVPLGIAGEAQCPALHAQGREVQFLGGRRRGVHGGRLFV